jgi:hypothetical protein
VCGRLHVGLRLVDHDLLSLWAAATVAHLFQS